MPLLVDSRQLAAAPHYLHTLIKELLETLSACASGKGDMQGLDDCGLNAVLAEINAIFPGIAKGIGLAVQIDIDAVGLDQVPALALRGDTLVLQRCADGLDVAVAIDPGHPQMGKRLRIVPLVDGVLLENGD